MLTPNLLSPELEDLQFQSHLPQSAHGQPHPQQPYPQPYPLQMGFPHQYPQGVVYQNGQPYSYGFPAAYPQPIYAQPQNGGYLVGQNGAGAETTVEGASDGEDAQFSLRRAEDERARQEIIAALQASGGHREKTAKLLGISAATLYRKLQKYGIA
jgi:DNA-binding NtrC family response regulator